ncbi:MAG: alpha/beta hydrolase fold domain-containing protein [Clostridia bacterium]|nr:alpha/beta hydrolase fold domain-containing protein [Clostridia bacterium]
MEDDKQRTLSQVKKDLREQKETDHDAYREGKRQAKATRRAGIAAELEEARQIKLQRKADKQAAKEALLEHERKARKARREDPQAWEDYLVHRKQYKKDKRESNSAYRFLHRQAHKVHAAYHEAYANEHLALQREARTNRSLRREIRDTAKEFWRVYGMHRYPLMADIFDLAEEDRAEPNSRTPFSGQIRVEKDIVYKTVDGEELKMDIYYPLFPSDSPAPCVMDVPGGGWMIHNRPRRDGYARVYAAMGAVVAVIDHRLCPKVFFPDNLVDCIDAYNYLVDHAEEYHLDPANITLTGDSSGGHLTACMGCAASSEEYVAKLGLPHLKTKPAALIAISGAFSFDVMYRIPMTHTLIVRYFSGQKTRKAYHRWEFYRESIPYNYLNHDFPPTYNNGGGTDVLCLGEAKRMARALNRAGVPNTYRVGYGLVNTAHCYVLRFPFANARRDALHLYRWYYTQQKARGVDLSQGMDKVEDFFVNYNESLAESK